MLRTLQLCGLQQPDGGASGGDDAATSARAALGLALTPLRPAEEEWGRGSTAPARHTRPAAPAEAGRTGSSLAPLLEELRALGRAADLAGLQRAWGSWQLAQLAQRRRDLWAELEVASYNTQALAE